MTESDPKSREAALAPSSPEHHTASSRFALAATPPPDDSEASALPQPHPADALSETAPPTNVLAFPGEDIAPIKELSSQPSPIAENTSSLAADAAPANHHDRNTAALPEELHQSLERLAASSLDVKLYLDSIDEKIARMEPRLEEMRRETSAAAEETSPKSEDHAFISLASETPPISNEIHDPPPVPEISADSLERRAPARDCKPRRRRSDYSAGDRRDPPFDAVALAPDEPWGVEPWLAAHRKWIPAAALCLFALLGLFLWTLSARLQHSGTIPMVGTGSALPDPTEAFGTNASPSRKTPNPPPSPPAIKPDAQTPLTSGIASGSVAHSGIASSTNPTPAPVDTAALPEKTSESTIAGPLHPIAAPTISSNATPVPPRIAPSAAREVHVSSGIMAANLISSRPPKYPGGFASLFHIEGKVTLQAVISRHGRVEDLRVLSGPHLLRGAARDAVATWRYRPYVVNGTPVEVATIVTVEFHR